jgi:ABC-type nitrate/sulfonate/bicarbonate transport system substrate-binding protein
MAAEVAVRGGTGTLVIDARRGDGPRGARHYTFAAMVAAQDRIDADPRRAAAAVRAVTAAQSALKADPSLAARAAQKLFPPAELALIEELVRRDSPYYEPLISQPSVRALNEFARSMGLLSREPAYEDVVAAQSAA